jgi:hypothetical protein
MLTAVPIPSAQLHVRDTRILISNCPKRRNKLVDKFNSSVQLTVPLCRSVLQISCSYSLQVIGTLSCKTPTLKTKLTALKVYFQVMRETGD